MERLDREQKTFYTLRAQARDRATNRLLEPESEFIIKVQDINDSEPRFLHGPYIGSVAELSPTGGLRGPGGMGWARGRVGELPGSEWELVADTLGRGKRDRNCYPRAEGTGVSPDAHRLRHSPGHSHSRTPGQKHTCDLRHIHGHRLHMNTGLPVDTET